MLRRTSIGSLCLVLVLICAKHGKAALLVDLAEKGVCIVSGLSETDSVIRKVELPEGSREVRYFDGRGIFALGQGIYHQGIGQNEFFGMQYLVSPDVFSEKSQLPDQSFFEFYSHQYFVQTQSGRLLSNFMSGYSCGSDFCATLGIYGQDLRIHRGVNDVRAIYEYETLDLTFVELEIFLDQYVIVRGDQRGVPGGMNTFLDVFDTKTEQRIFHYVPHSKFDIVDIASYENSLYLVFRTAQRSIPFYRRNTQVVSQMVYQAVFDHQSCDWDLIRCFGFLGSLAEIY